MTHSRTTRISIWRALLNGDCKQIHKTEEDLWQSLRNRNAWYEPENLEQWSAVVTEEDVPVVEGERHDWGRKVVLAACMYTTSVHTAVPKNTVTTMQTTRVLIYGFVNEGMV